MKDVRQWIIEDLPGKEGWWNTENCDTFVKAANDMLEAGISAIKVREIVESLYIAMSNEHGC